MEIPPKIELSSSNWSYFECNNSEAQVSRGPQQSGWTSVPCYTGYQRENVHEVQLI